MTMAAIISQKCIRARPCSSVVCRTCSLLHVSNASMQKPLHGACLCHTAATLRHHRRSQSVAPHRRFELLPPPQTAAGPFHIDGSRRFSATGQDSTSETSSQPVAPLRAMVKDWVQYLSRISPSSVDISLVTRALTSLHIDLPRNLPDHLRSMIPGISTTTTVAASQRILTLPENRNQGKPEDGASSMTAAGGDITQAKELIMMDKTRQTLVANPPKLTIQDYGRSSKQREQHDFASAMTSVCESVETFHQPKPVTLPPSNVLTPDVAQLNVVPVKSPSPPLESSTAATPSDTTVASAASSVASYLPNAIVSRFNTMTTSLSQQFAGIMTTMPADVGAVVPRAGGGGETAVSAGDSNKEKKPAGKVVVTGKAPATEVAQQQPPTPKSGTVRRQLVARGSIERQTRGLVLCLRDAKSSVSQLVRMEDLCRHILTYPDCVGIAIKCKVVPCLLGLRKSHDTAVAEKAREGLALVGYVDPVKGRGIRVLCLDGGGTKGLVSISIMRKLEEMSGRSIHQLFDYVCGVSTGSLIGIMAAVYRVPVPEMEEIYKEFSVQMFERNRLVGAGKLFMSHAYYDTELWERILRENIGLKTLLETARDPLCPKFSAVSTLVNVPRVQNFLFRNYSLAPTRPSHYAGCIDRHVWESIRASSAAPGYYEECPLGEHVHQDGGLLTNNPTAIAIHECRLLWPGVPLQCVVSIGTGKYEPTSTAEPAAAKTTSLKLKVAKIVESATDTEAVHTVLHDLLPASTYFRFNPYMSEEFQLDEVRANKWEQMKNDTEMYCRKNALQIEHAVNRLTQPKPTYARAIDWLRLRADCIA